MVKDTELNTYYLFSSDHTMNIIKRITNHYKRKREAEIQLALKEDFIILKDYLIEQSNKPSA